MSHTHLTVICAKNSSVGAHWLRCATKRCHNQNTRTRKPRLPEKHRCTLSSPFTLHILIPPYIPNLSPSFCFHSSPLGLARTEPWEYVLFAGIGGYVASQVPRWEQQMFNDINEMRKDRHMPPMVAAPTFGVGTPKTNEKES